MSRQDWIYLELLRDLEENTFADAQVQKTDLEKLSEIPDHLLPALFAAADRIRFAFKGNQFDACSLINARSGLCSENCAFCAQSGHHNSSCETYGLKDSEEILRAAQNAKSSGAGRFCTVTSGGALSDAEFASLLDSLSNVHSKVDILLDASLGFLSEERATDLRKAGVTRFNHNLETSRDFYPSICTTHDFQDRVTTVETVLRNGISACSGGIIGMGETMSQRLDLALTLRDLGVDCVPVNILNPRPGTPLENAVSPAPMEILKTIALFRLALPKATIKVAGGREQNLGDFQGMALRSGANGMIIGGYLTTSGRSVNDDLKMIRQAGYDI